MSWRNDERASNQYFTKKNKFIINQEVPTGEYFNDREIYRKWITFTIPNSNNGLIHTFPDIIDTMIWFNGFYYHNNGDNLYNVESMNGTQYIMIYFQKSSNSFYLQNGSGRNNLPGYILCEYTKNG